MMFDFLVKEFKGSHALWDENKIHLSGLYVRLTPLLDIHYLLQNMCRGLDE